MDPCVLFYVVAVLELDLDCFLDVNMMNIVNFLLFYSISILILTIIHEYDLAH